MSSSRRTPPTARDQAHYRMGRTRCKAEAERTFVAVSPPQLDLAQGTGRLPCRQEARPVGARALGARASCPPALAPCGLEARGPSAPMPAPEFDAQCGSRPYL